MKDIFDGPSSRPGIDEYSLNLNKITESSVIETERGFSC